ncbi:MAG: pyruvate:ferredoxin (flavodoxin) oxidoreductase [Thermoleophilia bacterium]|nr:pyruvate:ferredoxin (flavodoxin) oxidoreductase [Thermoleophilia bacterium]
MGSNMAVMDGTEAIAHVAHKVNEVIAIYPITPSSPIAEHTDAWSAAGKTNLWGSVPVVVEMQSEGGAAAAVHGALQAGSLSTTFTASQGLLLMIPSMYKIAGELTPTCWHVTARSLAAQALSIFGDHQDVMAVRQTGFALLASNSVQEAHDLALVGSAATLKSRVPFIHFCDGFRTSHEVQKFELMADDVLRAMIDEEYVLAVRERAMTPDRPTMRGTSQNPDVYFQGRETVNRYYLATPAIVQEYMDRFAGLTGRSYHLFDYVGAPDAERVIVLMGSGAETAHETVEYLTARGEKVGVLKVRLYRPFSVEHFAAALPKSVKSLAVLDRTKEPGSAGEPLYLDVVSAVTEAGLPVGVVGGRYGLSSKEFTPAMVKAVFDELAKAAPKNHFTIGINDDVTHTSLDYDPEFGTEADDVYRALFYGLGSDGTVGANKNSIKIIGDDTEDYVQGYFVYDSKKAGVLTVSHLRFGPRPIRSAYLLNKADFIACHVWAFVERYKTLAAAIPGGTFLLNAPFPADEVWDRLPYETQDWIIKLGLKVYAINAYEVAKNTGMGGRINTIMQTCFFYLSKIIPPDEAIASIKKAIDKTYGKRGEKVVQMNYDAVDQAIANLHEIRVPTAVTSTTHKPKLVPGEAPDFVRHVTAWIMAGEGDKLPVSKIPEDGVWPVDTTRWEKRNIALEVPVWEPDLCIQCGKCSLHCPHACIRTKLYGAEALEGAPPTFKSVDAKGKEHQGKKWTVQVAVEDCTGCSACVNICPGKDKADPERHAINMAFQPPLRDQERENYGFFLGIPDPDRTEVRVNTVKGSQLLRPLFEYPGACAGCGETPYIKLLTQLVGDRLLIGNATGCSSIYGGNLPTTPYSTNSDGRGPTWNNSLFEDAAEFSYGLRLTVDKHTEFARELVHSLRDVIGQDLAAALLAAKQEDEAQIAGQRALVADLKTRLREAVAKNGLDYRYGQLLGVADYLVKKSVWGVGGDGWAFDIGYGGLDHVLASQRNINLLVLNTQMYSNTGGQMSKATPMGSVALFAAGGKTIGKKDLGSIAMTYGNIYVAQVAMGYSDSQTVRAFVEAESYDGPSLIIAYSHCISMGFDMSRGYEHQRMAVQSGSWICYRFDPRLAAQGKNPLQIDSKDMSLPVDDFVPTENRYNMLKKAHPEAAEMLWDKAQKHVCTRWQILKQQAEMVYSEACPFEPGVVDEEALAATGAREVTMESSGVNLPAGRDLEQNEES